MNHLVAPLELLFSPPGVEDDDSEGAAEYSLSLPLTSIGIGDGGNEVGMGKIFDTIVGSSIPNASQIACTVAADHLIVCSVSNWGGYALAAAVSLASFPKEGESEGDSHIANSLEKWLDNSLPREEEQFAACEALVAAGARDGISKQQEMCVDGMPFEESLRVMREIREIAQAFSKSDFTTL